MRCACVCVSVTVVIKKVNNQMLIGFTLPEDANDKIYQAYILIKSMKM